MFGRLRIVVCDAFKNERINLPENIMFVVGSNKGNRLEELECLNLSGRLELRHLERVKDHLDAKKANLVEKKGLRMLSLRWQRNNNSSRLEKDNIDEKVLEALEPHKNIETLHVRGFQGKYLPLWMSNSTLGKIVEIQIIDCQNCRRHSKLGELPHLKRLLLSNVGMEYIIEEDEVGRGSGNPIEIQFVALEELELSSLPNLKGLFKKQESKEAFPNLKKLKIEGCSLLTLPPVSYLEKLEDLECNSSTLDLFSKLDSLTSLHVTMEETAACFPIETLVRFTNVRELTINRAKEISVPVEGLQTLKENLISLYIFNCNIPEGLLRHLTALWFLYISSCPELVELPEEIKHLHNLTTLFLSDLPKMACLPEALRHLSSLESLYLNSLPELESLPEWLNQLTSLTVKSCPKLLSLPLTILNNLKALSVEKCPELEMRCKRGSGDYWHNIAHIPDLRIDE